MAEKKGAADKHGKKECLRRSSSSIAASSSKEKLFSTASSSEENKNEGFVKPKAPSKAVTAETIDKRRKRESVKRSSSVLSSSSKEGLSSRGSSSDEEYDAKDTTYSEARLGDGNPEKYPASQWKVTDLNNINIFYDDKPTPIKDLTENVKADLLANYPHIPDFEEQVKKFSNLTKDNLLISFDLKNMDDVEETQQGILACCFDEIDQDLNRAVNECNPTLNDLVTGNWLRRVEVFLEHTKTLIKDILFPLQESNRLKEVKELIRNKKKKKRGEKMERGDTSSHIKQRESHYQAFFSDFGKVFFLECWRVDTRTSVIREKIVSSTPDLSYPFNFLVNTNKKLLFVVEVKANPVKDVVFEHLEDALFNSARVLGQVGVELLQEVFFSAMSPSSLGILCMKTKLIFVYLRMPTLKSVVNILSRGIQQDSLLQKGNINYTRPFDMLDPEDRNEMCDLLYWLGFVQMSKLKTPKDK